jgi:chorismate mutase/prephenate dehydratase
LVGLRQARSSLSRNESVDVLRKKIDQIDEKIVKLLNDRAALAQKIGHTKSLGNQEVYVPHREKEVLERVSDLNRGPLAAHAVRSVFREIISGCRSLEAPLEVAFSAPKDLYARGAGIVSRSSICPTASIASYFKIFAGASLASC